MMSFEALVARIDRETGRVETLPEHLHAVAGRARSFADAFHAGAWGHIAGLWHDLGKVLPGFQRRIGTLDAPGSGERAEHSGLGAALAMSRFRTAGLPLAFAIAGHHAGLANYDESDHKTDRSVLKRRLMENQEALAQLPALAPTEILDQPLPPLPEWLERLRRGSDADSAKRSLEFFTRMLLSCLVDADRLVAERFDDDGKSDLRGRHDSVPALHDRLENCLAALQGSAADTPVNCVRAAISGACRDGAALQPGVFTLDVPTGGGKTLASMRFALRHAVKHDLRRVFVVIPYTSIIRQNAERYREPLGEGNVLEHHASLQQDKQDAQERVNRLASDLAAENWDAPIVVTTTVRFFESLFSGSTGACRRLHRLARSVIVLDEAQTLPPKLLAPILSALRELVEHYGCSVVLSTATQPALVERKGFSGLPEPRAIVDGVDMAPLRGRVRFEWPEAGEKWTNEDLAQRLRAHESALCIVNTKRDAREVAALLGERAIHLTTSLCPAHRMRVLAEVTRRLRDGEPCLLVATQLVEAGVDLDFPIVYRALAGLDSVVQAAGRCNREGRLTPAQLDAGQGLTRVFQPERDHPDKTLKSAAQVTREMLTLAQEKGCELDLNDPAVFEEFFRRFYFLRDLDQRKIQGDRATLNFETVEKNFRIIENDTASIVVPYEDGERQTALAREGAMADLREGRNRRAAFRTLQPFIVEVFPQALTALQAAGAVEEVAPGLWALLPTWRRLYDDRLGLDLTTLDLGPDSHELII